MTEQIPPNAFRHADGYVHLSSFLVGGGACLNPTQGCVPVWFSITPPGQDGIYEQIITLANRWRDEADQAALRSTDDPNAYLRMTIYERVQRETRALLNAVPPESDAPYRAVLGLLLENVHIGVSNESIVVEDRTFDAPAPIREALARLMEEWVDGS